MAIESLLEEYARLKGYFTIPRVPFKKKRGHGDIDVLAYNPKEKRLLIIECKAWGPPEEYGRITPKKKNMIIDVANRICENWKDFVRQKANKWSFRLEDLDEVWLIWAGYFRKRDEKEDLEKKITQTFKQKIGKNIKFQIYLIHELIEDMIREIRVDKDVRRKRYLDSAFELIRWLHKVVDKQLINLQEIFQSNE